MKDVKKDYPFTTISRELWLLLACAERNITKVQRLVAQPINWDIFIEMALHHRLVSLAYQTLSGLKEPIIPEQVLSRLREKYQKNSLQAMQMAGETVRLVKLLASFGIQTKVLKGAVLALRLYGDLASRTSRDIDILVQAEDLEKADELLVVNGYRREEPAYLMTPRRWRICLQNSRHFCYIHQKTGVYLELHWQIGYIGMSLPHSAGSFAATIEVAGCQLPVFTDEEWFLYLVMHGAFHAWFRLRWLCDIAVFLQDDQLDWANVMVLAELHGLQHVLKQAVYLAHQLLEAPMPLLMSPLIPGSSKSWTLVELAVPFFCDTTYEPSTITWAQGLYYRDKKYQVTLRSGWKNKLQFVLTYFAATESDVLRFPLPDSLYWLYYFIRPFTWLERRYKRGRYIDSRYV